MTLLPRLTAPVMAVVLIITGFLVLSVVDTAQANEPLPIEKVTDPSTYHQYPGANGEKYFEASGNRGNIWVDKSVFSNNFDLPGDMASAGVGSVVLDSNELGVVLSALAPMRHAESTAYAPIDDQASGYVTITDPLGPFMEVTEISQLSFCSILDHGGHSGECQPEAFTSPTETDLGGRVTQYTFQGAYTVDEAVGPVDVSSLIVKVRRFELLARSDELTIMIPRNLLPMAQSHITTDGGADPVELHQTVSHPLHLFYKVAPKPGVVPALANPTTLNLNGSHDGTVLAEYIAAHKTQGWVPFYAGGFVGGVDGTTQPTTSASWQAGLFDDHGAKGFDSVLYSDQGLTRPVTPADWEALGDEDEIWYHLVEYVDNGSGGIEKSTPAWPTTKSKLMAVTSQSEAAKVTPGDDVMVASKGLLDIIGLGSLNHVKCLDLDWQNHKPVCRDQAGTPAPGNITQTTDMARTMEYAYQTLTTRLGNNGFIRYSLPGTLTVRQVVQAATGFVPSPDTSFIVNGEIQDSEGRRLNRPFDYSIYDVSDVSTPITFGRLTPGDPITLKDGQQVTVMGLPEGARFRVYQETPLPSGFVLSSSAGATGTIDLASDEAALIQFVNTYSPEPVKVEPPKVSTMQRGDNWSGTNADVVTMCLATASGPACQSAKYDLSRADSGTADLPEQTFDTPGTYVYTITQDYAQSAQAVSSSAAVYQWVVRVIDDGHGRLEATTALSRLLTDQGVTLSPPVAVDEVMFIDTYDEHQTSANLAVTMAVLDTSTGLTAVPQRRESFIFEYLGANLGNPDAAPPSIEPLFKTNNGFTSITTSINVGSRVLSPDIILTWDHPGQSFYYRAWQEPGSSPTTTYSSAIWYWRIVNRFDQTGAMARDISHCVTTVGDEDRCDPVSGDDNYSPVKQADRLFVNQFTPIPGLVDFKGFSVLDGRPWMPNDAYTFTLAANDTFTKAAVDNGQIIMAVTKTNAGPGLSGVAPQPFSFDGVTFKQPGSYQFKVTQDPTTQTGPGMSYDSRVAIYEVVVDDPGRDGNLRVQVSVRGNPAGDSAASFVNRYRAAVLFYGMFVTSTLEGRDLQMDELVFSVQSRTKQACDVANFLGRQPLGECRMTTTNGTGGSDPSRTHLYSESSFTQADIGAAFQYTLIQADTGLSGVDYDETIYYLTLEPSYDHASGAMYIMTTVEVDGWGGVFVSRHDSRTGFPPTARFTNTYSG